MNTSPLHSGVTWIPASDAHQIVPRATRLGTGTIATDRIAAWLMILLLTACVAVAVYDLCLLLMTL